MAAARTVMRARLGWLRGFPTLHPAPAGVEWTVVPAPDAGSAVQRFTLDGPRLYATVHAVKRLRGRFPRALPRIVSDVDAWATGIQARVALLDGALHRAEPLPAVDQLAGRAGVPAAARKALGNAVQHHARLAELAAACLWIHWGDTPALQRVAELLSALAGPLRTLIERCAGDLPLHLVDWVAAKKVGALECLSYLGDEANWTTSLTSGEHLRSLRTALGNKGSQRAAALVAELSVPPPGLTPRAVADLLASSAGRPDRRDTALAALPFVLPTAALVRRWQAWWKRFGVWRQRFPYEEHQRLHDELTRLVQKSPGRYTLQIDRLIDGLEPVFTAQGGRLRAPILETLSALPAEATDQPAQVQFLRIVGGHCGDRASTTTRALEQALVQLARHVTSPTVATDADRAAWLTTVFFRLLLQRLGEDERWAPAQIARAFDGIRLLLPDVRRADGGDGETDVWDIYLTAVRSGSPLPVVVRLTRDLLAHAAARPVTAGSNAAAVEAALDLCDADAGAFCVLLESLKVWSPDALASLRRLVRIPTHRAPLREMLVAGEAERVARFLARAALLPAFSGPRRLESFLQLPELDAEVDVEAYPPALQPLLLELARVDPQADRSAARILGATFPRHTKLREEIRALSSLLARHPPAATERRMRVRLANLKARLAAGTTVSELRLRRLAEKLRRRTWQATLDRWDRGVAASVEEGISARLGERPPPDWLDEPHLGVIASLCRLPPAFRDLGFRLLRRRLGPAPWDLRDEPPNRSFLERMKRRGLITAPWLDGPPPLVASTPNAVVALSLEPDPMEVFRMGEHFGTCLSPGSVNFFSAVANAADINKRVLFARDGAGTVRGRCLLALTKEGHLLTFEPYAHDRRDDFPALARQFVLQLAAAMNTTVAARGDVERLVATDWYDDGPHDLTGAFAFLQEGSAFRRRLARLQPSELVAALEAELGRERQGRELVALVLPQLICLGELEARPELVGGLLPLLEEGGLDRRTSLQAASLARRAGNTAAAGRILAALSRPTVWRTMPHWEQYALAGELIAAGRAQVAMRLLREELRRDPDANDLRARACEALGRPHQALTLYREVLAGYGDRRHAQERIDVLERELGER